jgi:hypothetical protein
VSLPIITRAVVLDSEFETLHRETHRVQLLLAINIALSTLILFMPW